MRKAIAPLSTAGDPKFRKVESVIVSAGTPPDPFAFPLISVDSWKRGLRTVCTVKGAGLGNVRLVRIGGVESNGTSDPSPSASLRRCNAVTTRTR